MCLERVRCQSPGHELVAQPIRTGKPGPDAGGGRENTEDRGLPHDHPPDLAWRRRDRTEQGDVPVPLGDRQTDRTGDDENSDEQRHAAEYARHGDDEFASVVDSRRLDAAAVMTDEHPRIGTG